MGVHRWPPQPAPARRWPVLTVGPKGRKRQIVLAGLLVLLVMLLAACGRSAPAQPAPIANESRGVNGEPKGGTAASFPVQTSEGGQVSVAVTQGRKGAKSFFGITKCPCVFALKPLRFLA